jgi:hypothetical protein
MAGAGAGQTTAEAWGAAAEDAKDAAVSAEPPKATDAGADEAASSTAADTDTQPMASASGWGSATAASSVNGAGSPAIKSPPGDPSKPKTPATSKMSWAQIAR